MNKEFYEQMKKASSPESVRDSNKKIKDLLKYASDGSLSDLKDIVEDYNKVHSKLKEEIGHDKTAAALDSNDAIIIRTFYRENGIARKIMPPEFATSEKIEQYANEFSELPSYLIFIENNIGSGYVLPAHKNADAEHFYSNRARIYFKYISTPRYRKLIDELETTPFDIVQLIEENSLKEIPTQEDYAWFSEVDGIVNDNNKVYNFSSGISRETWVESKKALMGQRVPLGMTVINNSTILELEKWGREDSGGDIAQEIYKEGISAFGDLTPFGVKLLPTIKNEIVADDVLYSFATPKFTGVFLEKTKPQMHISKKGRFVEFYAEESIAMSLVNVNSVAKIVFNASE